jgi:hypothetical protein
LRVRGCSSSEKNVREEAELHRASVCGMFVRVLPVARRRCTASPEAADAEAVESRVSLRIGRSSASAGAILVCLKWLSSALI